MTDAETDRPKLWILANWGTAVGVVVLAFALGFVLQWGLAPATPEGAAKGGTGTPPAAAAAKVWSCPMHPQVRQDEPGTCPICGMPLALLKSGAGKSGDPRRITFSENAKALMRVRTVAVERRPVTADVRMVGKIDYDETRLAYITSWMPGRLDRLFVDYTGIPVRKGDHMVEIYSPDLLAAQEEFLQTRKAREALQDSDPPLVRDSVEATFHATREKLRLLGLTAEQLDQLVRRGKASDRLTIYAPAGGIVIDKAAQQGMYVQTGTRIYTIADLSKVWVRLDAYESDLAWLRYGQKVEFTTESLPGRTFRGMISFIDPVLTERTRTVRIRVNAANSDGALKPGMFVRAVVRSQIAAGGKVMEADLAGKWISPMHPEIIKDGPGKCDVCGMPLVRAESLGYVGPGAGKQEAPLVIPVSAALRTGKRAIVYVEVPDADVPTYEMRVVTLGPRAGDDYLVSDGLVEGEQVVVQGNFRIDSERQIQALPSMMDREGVGAAEHAHHGAGKPKRPRTILVVPEAFRAQFAKVFDSYFAASDALAGDDFEKALAASKAIRKALQAVDAAVLDEQARGNWQAHAEIFAKLLDGAAAAKGIEPLRGDFALLSDQMMVLASTFGPPGRTIYQIRCPMAFNNRGATWLQADQEVRNPYFGASMLRCGGVIDTLAPPAESDDPKPPTEGADDRHRHP